MPETTKTLQRRKFFGKLGKGLTGLLLLSAFPVKFFQSEKKEIASEKKIRIIEHPLAVKRNKKGLRG
ncbi:MAG: hypothetical protein HF314_12625 [Ignavibacteria bacterium]|nr:hypothetical protein [Ignavibacteria bacterium]MCU7503918.1 hypothetical protein [Ignavibacteria bacterium]MCU7515861.1 hypothetical protein [Ignavibacteria bacterium]